MMANTVTAREGDVHRPDVTLHYTEIGTGDPPIVLMHGMACDSTHMAGLATHLGRRHRTINIDMRGHGRSVAQPNAEFSIATMTSDIGAIIDLLELQQPVLIGHSLGGSLALAFAAAHPTRVRGIVLVDSGIRPLREMRDDLQSFYDLLGGVDHSDRVRTFVRERLLSQVDGGATDDVPELMARLPAQTFLDVARGVVLHLDSAALAAACTVPALNVLSDRPFTSRTHLEALRSNWRIGQVVGSGHFIPLVVPDQLASMVDRFLSLCRGKHVTC